MRKSTEYHFLVNKSDHDRLKEEKPTKSLDKIVWLIAGGTMNRLSGKFASKYFLPQNRPNSTIDRFLEDTLYHFFDKRFDKSSADRVFMQQLNRMPKEDRDLLNRVFSGKIKIDDKLVRSYAKDRTVLINDIERPIIEFLLEEEEPKEEPKKTKKNSKKPEKPKKKSKPAKDEKPEEKGDVLEKKDESVETEFKTDSTESTEIKADLVED